MSQLEYKAKWYGRQVVAIDRFYPSSKRCSNCGHTLTSLSLDVRQWTCTKCGVTHDRDINAAINIKAAGRAVLACEDGVRPSRSAMSKKASVVEARTRKRRQNDETCERAGGKAQAINVVSMDR